MLEGTKSVTLEQAGTVNYPDNYCINLLWINRTLDESKPYICAYESEKDLIEKFIDKAKKWKEANPDADVTIWYDGYFVTPSALAATQLVINKLAQENISYAVKLKNIREINMVKNNPDAFSDNIPVYFRVDLMKLIICVNSIEADGNQAAIFSDLEVGDLRATQDRMGKIDLFNPVIMKRLQTIGIQVNQDGCKDENQFIQVLNKTSTLNAIKTYINACLSRAIKALNLINNDYRDRYLSDLCTAVFNTMSAQLFPLIEMDAYNRTILVNENFFKENAEEKWVKYNFEDHGFSFLGNLYLHKYSPSCFIIDGNDIDAKRIVSNNKCITLSAATYDCPFSRSDLDTRSGGNHVEHIRNLVTQNPVDGSDTYKFSPWQVNEKTNLNKNSNASFETPEVQPIIHQYNKIIQNQILSSNIAVNQDQFHKMTSPKK